MGRFEVSHPGRREVDRIEAESVAEAIEIYRQRHGKIQTNHDYIVVDLPLSPEPPPEPPPEKPTRPKLRPRSKPKPDTA